MANIGTAVSNFDGVNNSSMTITYTSSTSILPNSPTASLTTSMDITLDRSDTQMTQAYRTQSSAAPAPSSPPTTAALKPLGPTGGARG